MDFHSLTRRELQSLCKLNGIPANTTNLAMADALNSLNVVEGIEKFLNPSKSETAESSVESPQKIEVTSPRIPRTSCRTSTRQKPKRTEAETLPPTLTRTTRRGGRKQLAEEVEESKKDMPISPALTTTRRKGPPSSACRKMENQFNECQVEVKSEGQQTNSIQNTPAAVVTYSRRNEGRGTTRQVSVTKQDSTVQTVYRTRRSARLTEKKSAEPSLIEKESIESTRVELFPEEVNVTSKEDSGESVEVPDSILGSGAGSLELSQESSISSENMEVGVEYCEVKGVGNAFDKLDVKVLGESAHSLVIEKTENVEAAPESRLSVAEEKVDCGELDSSKAKSDEMSNPCDDGELGEKLKVGLEKFDLADGDNLEPKSSEICRLKAESDDIFNPCENGDSNEELKVEEEKFVLVEVNNSKAKSEPHCEPVKVGARLKSVVVKVDCGELDNSKARSDETSNSCEEGSLEERLSVGEEKFDLIIGGNSDAKGGGVDHLKTESDDMSNPCEDGDLEEELNVGAEKFDLSEVDNSKVKSEEHNVEEVEEHNVVLVPEEHSNSLLDNKAELVSALAGTNDIDVEAITVNTENLHDVMKSENWFCAVSETKNQIPESDGMFDISTNCHLTINTENLHDVMKSENLFCAASETKNQIPESDVGDVIHDNGKEAAAESVNEEVLDEMEDVNTVYLLSEATAEERNARAEPTAMATHNLPTLYVEVQKLKPELSTESYVNQKFSATNYEAASMPLNLDCEQVKEEADQTIVEVQDLKPELSTESAVNQKVSATNFEAASMPLNLDCEQVKEEADQTIADISHSGGIENQIRFFPIPCLPTEFPSNPSDDINHHLTPTKKRMTNISDDKENIDSGKKLQLLVDEGKKSKKEAVEDEKLKSLHKKSIRQLKKQLKALTIKSNMTSNEDATNKVAKTRPALQALCDNQLAAGEMEN